MLLNGRALIGWRSSAKCQECGVLGRTLLPQEDLHYRGSGLRPVYVLASDGTVVVSFFLCAVDYELYRLWVAGINWGGRRG